MREEREPLLFVPAKLLWQNRDNVLYFLIIVFLPTQFGRHFWLADSLVAGLRVDYLSPTLYVTDLLIILLFIAIFFRRKMQDVFLPMRRHKSFIIMLVFVLFISIVFSERPLLGLYGAVKLFEFIFFGLYTRFIFLKQQNMISFAFAIGVLYESVIAMLQYTEQSSIGGMFYLLGERSFTSQTPGIANASIQGELILRPYGTFPHPNVLGGYLLIGMVFLISFVRTKMLSKQQKLFFFLTLFLSSIALFTTLSRAAIFLWLVSLAWIYMGKRMKRIGINHLPIWLFVLGIPFFLFSGVLRGRFYENILIGESFQQRKDLIMSSLAMWRDNQLFGVGLNNFLVRLPSYITDKTWIFYLQPVHNVFFLALAEIGIIGVFFLFFFFWKTYRVCAYYSLLPFFIICILGSADHYLFTLQQGQLMTAFILGICWTKNKKNRYR